MFHNVSARLGSSHCNRARLNFHAFALRDMKNCNFIFDHITGENREFSVFTSLVIKNKIVTILTPEDFTLSNARRFYSSKGDP